MNTLRIETGYLVEIFRKDGTSFIAENGQYVARLSAGRKDAMKFRRELALHRIPMRRTKIIPVEIHYLRAEKHLMVKA